MVPCVMKAHVADFPVVYDSHRPTCFEHRNQKRLTVKDHGGVYTSIIEHNIYIYILYLTTSNYEIMLRYVHTFWSQPAISGPSQRLQFN